jgi:hypothetical protein
MKTYEHLEKMKERLAIFENIRNQARVRELRELIEAEERALERIEATKEDE